MPMFYIHTREKERKGQGSPLRVLDIISGLIARFSYLIIWKIFRLQRIQSHGYVDQHHGTTDRYTGGVRGIVGDFTGLTSGPFWYCVFDILWSFADGSNDIDEKVEHLALDLVEQDASRTSLMSNWWWSFRTAASFFLKQMSMFLAMDWYTRGILGIVA